MSTDRNDHEPDTAAGPLHAGRYEIRLKGHLDPRWAAWFDGLRLAHDADGATRLSGLVVDQAALHGLLHQIRDLGIPLTSVAVVDPSDGADRHPRS